jgi:hypothetical protein
VQCLPCKRQWTSERVENIADDLRFHMDKQMQSIVSHMDFSDDCLEVKKP